MTIRYKYYAITSFTMADDFDKDMKEYLASRKKNSLFGNVLKEKQPEVRLHPEVETYEQEASAPQEAEQESFTMEQTPAKKGFFSRLFSKKENEEPIIASVELMDDLKRVSKTALGLAKQLSPEQLESFKRSAEYDELKNILKKRNLIK